MYPPFTTQRDSDFFSNSPFQCQFVPHVAALVARNNLKQYKLHQRKSKDIFLKTTESQKLRLNDLVLKALKKRVITKEVSVFFPRWSLTSYRITKVYQDRFPRMFSLSQHPQNKK